jgi:hypothetical protein
VGDAQDVAHALFGDTTSQSIRKVLRPVNNWAQTERRISVADPTAHVVEPVFATGQVKLRETPGARMIVCVSKPIESWVPEVKAAAAGGTLVASGVT